MSRRLCVERTLLTPQSVAAFAASLGTTFTGQRPQLKAPHSLCLSMMKPRTKCTPSRLRKACARDGSSGNPSRQSTVYHPHNVLACRPSPARGAMPCDGGDSRHHRTQSSGDGRAGLPSNDPSIRNCCGSDLPTTPLSYADVVRCGHTTTQQSKTHGGTHDLK